MALTAALRRLCVVMLEGEVRWVHVLPMPETIETSIVWEAGSSRPDISQLPCLCQTAADFDTDENADVSGLASKYIGDLDERTPAPALRENARLIAALLTSDPGDKSDAGFFLEKLDGASS